MLWRGGHHQAALVARGDVERPRQPARAVRSAVCVRDGGSLQRPAPTDLIDICDRHTHVVTDSPSSRSAWRRSAATTRRGCCSPRSPTAARSSACCAIARATCARPSSASASVRIAPCKLQNATARLAAALTQEDVAAALLVVAEDVLQASAGVVYLRGADGELHLRASIGLASPERWKRTAAPHADPLSTAVNERYPVLCSTRASLLEQYPHLTDHRHAGVESPGGRGVAVDPRLDRAGRVRGLVRRRSARSTRKSAAGSTASRRRRRWRRIARASTKPRKRAREEAETLFRVGESLSATQLDLGDHRPARHRRGNQADRRRVRRVFSQRARRGR